MIAIARHQDELAAGEAPRDVRREHPGFGPRIAKSHALDRLDALAQQRRELDLRLRARRPRAAVLNCLGRSLDDRRIRVAMNQAGVIAEQVDIPVAVNVPQKRPFAALDGQRVGLVIGRRARVAAGHHAFGALGELRRFFGRCAILFFDSGHRPHPLARYNERLRLCFHYNFLHRLRPSRRPMNPTVYYDRADESNCKKL